MEVKTIYIRGKTSSPPIYYFLPQGLFYGGNYMISFQTLLLTANETINKAYCLGLRCNFVRSISSLQPGVVTDDKSILHIFNLSKDQVQTTVSISTQWFCVTNIEQKMELELLDLEEMKPVSLKLSIKALFLYKRRS